MGTGGFGAAGIEQLRLQLGALCAGRGELLGSAEFWSLGIVLFEPLIHSCPSQGGSQQHVGAQALQGSVPFSTHPGWAFSEPGCLLQERELQSLQLLQSSNTFVQLCLFPLPLCFTVGSQPFGGVLY